MKKNNSQKKNMPKFKIGDKVIVPEGYNGNAVKAIVIGFEPNDIINLRLCDKPYIIFIRHAWDAQRVKRVSQ